MQIRPTAFTIGLIIYSFMHYFTFTQNSGLTRYSVGTAPVIGYHFGAENKTELKSLLKKSSIIIGVFAVCMFVLAEALAHPLAGIFVSYDANLMDMTLNAFKIFSFSFLCAGFSIFGSAFFTALNDGLTSALISFLRTLVFQVAAVLILPIFFDLNGIWFSIVAAEIISVIVTVIFVLGKKKKYGYM